MLNLTASRPALVDVSVPVPETVKSLEPPVTDILFAPASRAPFTTNDPVVIDTSWFAVWVPVPMVVVPPSFEMVMGPDAALRFPVPEMFRLPFGDENASVELPPVAASVPLLTTAVEMTDTLPLSVGEVADTVNAPPVEVRVTRIAFGPPKVDVSEPAPCSVSPDVATPVITICCEPAFSEPLKSKTVDANW